MRNAAALFALGRLAVMPASPALAYKVYVSNEKGNSVSVLDSDSMEVIKTIKVGQRPRGITISKDGKFLYVCASDDDTIEIIDTSSYEIVGTLPSGPDPELFVLSPDGKRLYVANEDDNLVTVIDLEKRSVIAEIPVGVEPEGMGVSPDGKTVVNTSETTNMAHFIDTATHEIVANVLVDSRPRFAEFKRGRLRAVGVGRDRRHGQRDRLPRRAGQAPRSVRDPRARQGGHSAGRRADHRGRQDGLCGARTGQPGRGVDATPMRSQSYLLVGQRVWQLAFTPTRNISSRPTASRTMSRSSTSRREPVIKSIQVGELPWGVVVQPQ